MRFYSILMILAMTAGFTAVRCFADEPAVIPDRVDVPTLSTSIYVGRVKLEVAPILRSGDSWTSTYTARVFPWAFWNEHGDLALDIPLSDVERLLRGETVEFSGQGTNHKGKPRQVTGRAQPEGPQGGRIKIRISADGVELVFDGRYTIPETTRVTQ